jgi:protein-disulfide isomerase
VAEKPRTQRPVQAPKPVPKQRRKPPAAKALGGISRKWLYAGAAGLAVVIAAVLIVVSVTGGGSDSDASVSVAGPEVEQLLTGIPQDGNVLGSPDASVTLVEFADPQCPFCARWATDVLPTLIKEYVRPGDVRIVLRGVGILGDDSNTALQYLYAAGEQNKLWNVVELMYRNQGAENDGWVTEDLMRAIGEAVPGLDVDKWMSARGSTAVSDEIASALQEAQAISLPGTPTFLIGPNAGDAELLQVDSLTVEEFRQKLDDALTQ